MADSRGWLCTSISEVPINLEYFQYIPDSHHLLCQACDKNLANMVPRVAVLKDFARPWLVEFKCLTCQVIFKWCRVCKPDKCMLKNFKHMLTEKHVDDHEGSRQHKTIIASFRDEDSLHDQVAVAFEDDADAVSMHVDGDDTETLHPTANSDREEHNSRGPVRTPFINWSRKFPNHENAWFFESEAVASGLGFSNISSRAIHNMVVGKIDPLVSLYMLLLAQLNESLTGSQSEMLAMLLDFAARYVMVFGGLPTPVPLPTNKSKMYSMFGNGVNSIKNNIPKIRLKKYGAFVVALPSDCLREAMALGITERFFPGDAVEQSKSPRGQDLINRAKSFTIIGQAGDFQIIIYHLWEDDFDPNDVKGNRHKIFVQVFSVGPKDATIHSTRNTYIICMGPSNKDRTEATRAITADLEELSKGLHLYDGRAKQFVPTIALVFSIQADSPAKAAAMRLLAGNSHNHSRFGYAGDVSEKAWDFPSCDACWSARKEGIMRADSCTICFDWCFPRLTFATPDDYPKRGLVPPAGKVLPVKSITLRSCKTAVDNIYWNVKNGEWKKKGTARCYGKTEALTVDLVDEIYDAAKNNTGYSYPPSWEYPATCLSTWLPAPMHLLFLGVAKAVFGEFIMEWLTARKMKSFYTRFVRDRLELLGKLYLPWVKAEPLTTGGNFGRFVSENYLAFVKVCKWLLANMDPHDLATDESYEDPPADKAIGDYSIVELRGWLKARKKRFRSNCSWESLHQLCLKAIEENRGVVPPIPPIARHTATVEEVESLVTALHAMISRVMISGVIAENDVSNCDRHVKHFLSCLAKFLSKSSTEPDRTKKALPSFITKYNFMNLLSIPEAMKEFHSLRKVWEGDGKGEGALSLLKQNIKSLKGTEWPINGLSRHFVNRGIGRCTAALLSQLNDMGEDDPLQRFAESVMGKDLHETIASSNIEENEAEFDPLTIDHHTVSGQGHHRVLKNKNEFDRIWESSVEPLSIVQVDNGSFYAVIMENKEKKYLKLNCFPSALERKVTCGAYYHKWSIGMPAATMSSASSIGAIKEHCVLLPHHRLPEFHHYYYLITSDWLEMLADGSIGHSEAIGVTYP